MNIDALTNSSFLLRSHWCTRVIPAIALFGILLSNWLVFTVVPNEKVMGAVQRIFYFHVGSAMAAYLMVAVMFVSSVFYLATKKDGWDMLAEAAAVVGLMLCTVVLASGMIWGRSAWNTWWRWEPRLVSFLVLWLILFSYVILRSFSEGHARQKNFAAVLAIIAAVNVPIVIYSVKLLDHSQQLHPEVVAKQGLRDASFVYTLVCANVSMLVLSVWLMLVRTGTLVLERSSRMLQIELTTMRKL